VAGNKKAKDLTEEEVREFIRNGYTTIEEIKRFSKAGMGHCQGRSCSRLIASLISRETGKPVGEIKKALPRPPVKPVSLRTFARLRRTKKG